MKTQVLSAMVAVALAMLAGCGGQEFPGRDTTPPTTVNARTAPKAKPPTANLGDSIRLDAPPSTLRVTASSILDPVVSGNEFLDPKPGNRFVGVEMILENVGEAGVSETPSIAARLIYGDDRQARPALVISGECDAEQFAGVDLAPGDRRMGCVAFEIPEGDAPRKIQYTPTSGMSTQTGEWLATAKSTPGTPGTAPGKTSKRAPKRCGNGVAASEATSCQFAEAIASAYPAALAGWNPTETTYVAVTAFSEAVGQSLTLYCDDVGVLCEGGNGAVVTFEP